MGKIEKIVIVTESTEWQNLKKAFPNLQIKGFASGGHIKQLKEDGGVDFKTMAPIYEWIPKPTSGPFKDYPSKKQILKNINDAGEWADVILLCADSDREGEKIAASVYEELTASNKKKAARISLNDWSKDSLQTNIIDKNFAPQKVHYPYHNELPWLPNYDKVGIETWLVAAQAHRAVLDQVMGYSLSRYIWGKVSGAKSLGRVQSPILLLLMDRKLAIDNFKSATSYGFQPIVHTDKPKQDLPIDLIKLNQKYKVAEDALYSDEDDKSKIIKFNKKADLENYIKQYCPKNAFLLEDMTKTETSQNPALPFDTLTLNKVASSKFGWPIKKINEMLEDLYKAGLTSYPRSDANNFEPAFVKKSLAYLQKDADIKKDLNIQADVKKYYFMKLNKDAQAGHTAVQPVTLENVPEKIKNEIKEVKSKHSFEDLYKIYEFIYERTKLAFFKASKTDNYTLTFDNNDSKFVGKFSNLTYAGWKAYVKDSGDEEELMENNLDASAYKKGETYKAKSLGTDSQKTYITKPPKNYTWSSIIAQMKKLNIGRPATLKTMVTTLEARKYVTGGNGKKPLLLTELGLKVAQEIKAHLGTLINYTFTREMEETLDRINCGENIYDKQMLVFLKTLNKCLTENGMPEYKGEQAIEKTSPGKKQSELTNLTCPKCGKPLKKVEGKFGTFYSCSNYPKCDYSQKSDKQVKTYKCPKCGKTMIDFEWTDKKTGKKRISRKCLNSRCKYVEW